MLARSRFEVLKRTIYHTKLWSGYKENTGRVQYPGVSCNWASEPPLDMRVKEREKVTRTWRIRAVRRDPLESFGDGLSQPMGRELEK